MTSIKIKMTVAIAAFLCAFLAVSCQSAGPQPDPTAPSQDVASAVTEPSAIPTELPAPTEATDVPALADPSAIPDTAQNAYLVLLTLEFSAALMEETASSLQEGSIDGTEALGQLLAIGVILNAASDVLFEPPIEPVLEDTWNDAGLVSADLKELTSNWFNKEIDSSVVLQELPVIRGNLNAVLEAAEVALGAKYGIDSARMTEFRTQEIIRLLEGYYKGSDSTDDATEDSAEVIVEVAEVNWYVDTLGTLAFIGTVRNLGESDLEFVKVIISLRDAGGTLVDTDFTYTETDVVLSGEASPFHTIFLSEPPEWSDFEVVVEAREASDGAYRELQILSSSGRPSEFGWYEIVGEVENTGSQDAEFVKVVAMLYDAEDNLVDVDFTYVAFDTVSAGQSSPFKLTILTSGEGEIERYELIAEGNEKR